MDSIEQHIAKDKEILHDPTVSPQMRRHIEGELHDLEAYAENHKKEIEAGDHHDPNYLELFCDQNPSEPECLIYDDWVWQLHKWHSTLDGVLFLCDIKEVEGRPDTTHREAQQ